MDTSPSLSEMPNVRWVPIGEVGLRPVPEAVAKVPSARGGSRTLCLALFRGGLAQRCDNFANSSERPTAGSLPEAGAATEKRGVCTATSCATAPTAIRRDGTTRRGDKPAARTGTGIGDRDLSGALRGSAVLPMLGVRAEPKAGSGPGASCAAEGRGRTGAPEAGGGGVTQLFGLRLRRAAAWACCG